MSAALGGIRTRVLLWFVALLALSVVVGLVLLDRTLEAQLQERTDRFLAQEAEELRLALEPALPIESAGALDAAVRGFLAANVPDRDEAFLFLIDGEVAAASERPPAPLTGLGLDAEWSGVETTTWGDATSAVGPVRWMATPLTGESTRGTFVAATFPGAAAAETSETLRTVALVWGGVFLLAAALGWVGAGRALKPLRDLRATADRITDTDLTQRIAVTDDTRLDDEVAQLARTFNGMLDRLERAFSGQRDFLDDVAHELRTPVTIIRGHLEVLPDAGVGRQDSLAVAYDELDRMARLVDDLLLLARAERPEFLRLDLVELSDLVTDVASKVTTLGNRRWVVDATVGARIEADRQRLEQALLNLAANAVRHTPEGAEIGIGCAVEGATALLWVRDTGEGIPGAEQARLFERFTQGSGRGRAGAAGLGLAIVRAVVDAHGGTVRLASAPGAGTTVTLVVPLDHVPSVPVPHLLSDDRT